MGKICTIMLAIMSTASVMTYGAIIAQDDFTYADGPLTGNAGGTGWAAAWSVMDGTPATVSNGVVQSAFPGGSGWHSSQMARTLNMTLTDAWIRATVQKTVTAGKQDSFGGIGLYQDGSEKGLIGNFWPGSAVDVWGAGQNGAPGEIPGKLVTTLSDVIVHISASGMEIWVNPADPMNLGTADAVGGGIGQFNRIAFRCGTNDAAETWQFDNLIIGETAADVTGGIRNSVPDNGETDVDPAGLVMEWIGLDDPNIASVLGYTIYLDPNETYVTNLDSAQMDYFDDAIPGTQTTYEPVPDLTYETTYFWRIVETVQYDDKAPGDVNDIVSDVWSFTTKMADSPPVVNAGPKFIMTTALAATPFSLEGAVTDDGVTPVTIGWEAFEVALGGGLTTKVIFADATDPNTIATISEAGSYVLKLTAADGYNPSVSAQKEVVVLDDGCQAIKSTGSWAANYYDRNDDCVVDLADFAVFALEWLDSTALAQPYAVYGIGINDPDNPEQLVAEYWLNVAGTDVNDLLADPRYPASPDGAFFIANEFRAPSNSADNFGRRIYGYIVPPVTGDYTFYIASDDQSRLFLSTDTTPVDTDPALGNQIAEVPDPAGTETGWTNVDQWDKYPEQTSAPVSLTAGQYYYIEALQKEGGANDHLSVGWKLPDASEIVVIPGTALRYTAP